MNKNRIFKLFFVISLLLTGCSKQVKITGTVSENTKFHSAIVDISIEDFEKEGFTLGDSCNIKFSNGYKIDDVPFYNGYYVKNEYPVIVAYPGDENIAITYNNAGIWDKAKLKENDKVTISLNKKAKYIDTQEALGQMYSFDRNEYTSDEEFSNFRALSGGNLKDNLLYRGASPVDNSRKRASITSSLLEANNINYVIDLADDESDMNNYFASADFNSTYAKTLYDNNKVTLLDMGSAYQSLEYATKVANGFTDMLENDGPYYIHCMEGKDRTGFVCMLIEALAEASYEEMLNDYMTTYYNYFKISKENSLNKYKAVEDLYFVSFMTFLSGNNDENIVKTLTYKEYAINYLKNGGMSEENINKLIEKITK